MLTNVIQPYKEICCLIVLWLQIVITNAFTFTASMLIKSFNISEKNLLKLNPQTFVNLTNITYLKKMTVYIK